MKSLIYLAYVSAGTPTLDEMAALVAADDGIGGSPSRDTIGRLIGDATIPARQADVLTLLTVLTRMAAGDVTSIVQHAARLWTEARLVEPIGRLVADLDPHALEVHHAIAKDGVTGLPAYVERDHDARLRTIVTEVTAGASRLAMLVGTSSTGKTRACWEAVQQLPMGWRLWHPIDPERPQAALAELSRVGPRTVVWLNEAQHYLLNEQHGEAIAAGLRELLADSSRGPVLVLGTIWPGPNYFGKLTTQPAPGDPDPFGQARVLLANREIHLPPAFTQSVIDELTTSTDPRLVEAATHARDGLVTQYLAGAPELIKIYQTATPGPRALLEAAMDARRLGHPLGLPLAFLEAAAEAYLTDTEWDLLPDNWLIHSLTLLSRPVKGARGPLHPQKRARGAAQPISAPTGQSYRLADFLDQHGRATRHLERVPALFWTAAVQHSGAEASKALANAALHRGMTQTACLLFARAGSYSKIGGILAQSGRLDEALAMYEKAADAGDFTAVRAAIKLLTSKRRVDEALAWHERAVAAGDLHALSSAGRFLSRVGRLDEALSWYERAAASGNGNACRTAADDLARADRLDEALTWYERAAVTDDLALQTAAGHLTKAGRLDEARAWYVRAASADNSSAFLLTALVLSVGWDRLDEALLWYEKAASAGDTHALQTAAERLVEAGRLDEALTWYERAATAGIHNALQAAADKLVEGGRLDEALLWYEKAASAGDPLALHTAAEHLSEAGRLDEALTWYERAVAAGSRQLTAAAHSLTKAGRLDEALTWFERAATATGNPYVFFVAAKALADAGRLDEALTWYERAAAGGFSDATQSVGDLLAEAGRLDEALTWYERAAIAGERRVLLQAASHLEAAARQEEALAWYERATRMPAVEAPGQGKLRFGPTGIPDPAREAVIALRALGRHDDAEALRLYGWGPSGRIADPWDVTCLLNAPQPGQLTPEREAEHLAADRDRCSEGEVDSSGNRPF
ncbi:tetratricopeptide repeat protein [Streptomyces goshikiensis]|uniref:tetratricopeptide repeat protein n=1 Tax=Streptomyces goshikiensis TaxID=1942 RepID=UPI00366372F5